MAKPGPALALAALAAFFLMRGKGKGGSGAAGMGDLPDGSVVPDPAPAQPPGAPSGGGTKVPKGSGTGGGKFDAGNLLPNKVWISPDCLTVVEGKDYFDEVILPRFIEAQESLSASFEAGDLEGIDATQYDQSVGGGGFYVNVYIYLAAVFGLIDSWGGDEYLYTFSTDDNMYTPPRSCLMQFPGFHIADRFNALKTTADSNRFEEALGEYNEKYPEMTSWLLSLEDRLSEVKDTLGEVAWVFSA